MRNPSGDRAAQVPVEASASNDLVRRMQGGDLDAFEEFFNTYKRPVYATALAITRDPFLAEEVLQDCFVKAYRVRERLDPERRHPARQERGGLHLPVAGHPVCRRVPRSQHAETGT